MLILLQRSSGRYAEPNTFSDRLTFIIADFEGLEWNLGSLFLLCACIITSCFNTYIRKETACSLLPFETTSTTTTTTIIIIIIIIIIKYQLYTSPYSLIHVAYKFMHVVYSFIHTYLYMSYTDL